jgi:endothelin-converting enzyme/putative endopeptidase
MKNTADVGRMIGRFHKFGIAVPFSLGSSPDNRDPNQIVANIYASGLDLPDRDYYLKPEPRFKEGATNTAST